MNTFEIVVGGFVLFCGIPTTIMTRGTRSIAIGLFLMVMGGLYLVLGLLGKFMPPADHYFAATILVGLIVALWIAAIKSLIKKRKNG